MKIIFFGTSKLGVGCLESLLKAGHDVACVVTMPDKKSGRHLMISESPIKQVASKSGLRIYQPENVNSLESIAYFKDLQADIFIVIAFGGILKKEILDLPKFGAINIHFSLLPKYRGAAPINWAIANGETKTGITAIKMNEFIDKGDVILQKEINIDSCDNAITLGDKLTHLAPEVLDQAIGLLTTSGFKPILQDENFASYAPSLNKSFGLIKWNRSAEQIHNQVRAFLPWPGTFTHFKGLLIKVLSTQVIDEDSVLSAGSIVRIDRDGIIVATKKYLLKIVEIQPEAKRRMTASEFNNGYKIVVGDFFS